MASLDLYLHHSKVGVISPARDTTRVTLDIQRNYDSPVLLSELFAALPGRRPASDAVSNFLGGYVPEGNHRERMASKRHIPSDDLFALLREFGGSIAGAVTLRKPDETTSDESRYEALSEKELTARLKRALEDSDQGIPDDSRSTLPGYQPKVLLASFGDEWYAPHGAAHSTHILKPQVPSRPSRIFDEHYSHLLTSRIGLSQYASSIRYAGRTKYLSIERFDRTISAGTVHLHHQEDLAQALGLDWRDTDVKFQDPEWPTNPKRATAKRIAELLGSIPGGDAAVEAWIRQLVYTVVIGNNDAHAKNVALMHLPSGTELAQIYDAVPNLFQEGLVKWDLALAIDGVFDHRRMSVERLLREIDGWSIIRSGRAADIVETTLASLDEALGAVRVPAEASPGMEARLHWNISRLRGGTEISEPKRR